MLRWTSISSREEQMFSQSIHATEIGDALWLHGLEGLCAEITAWMHMGCQSLTWFHRGFNSSAANLFKHLGVERPCEGHMFFARSNSTQWSHQGLIIDCCQSSTQTIRPPCLSQTSEYTANRNDYTPIKVKPLLLFLFQLQQSL